MIYVASHVLNQMSFIQSAFVSLTAEEVKALKATPKVLIAAPECASMNQLLGMSMRLHAGSEVFVESTDNLLVRYETSDKSATGIIEMTGFIDSATSVMMNVPAIDLGTFSVTDVEDKALVLVNPHDEITGNASNDAVLEISVVYLNHCFNQMD